MNTRHLAAGSALMLALGLTPGASAAPALQGSIAAGHDFHAFCNTSGPCAAFFTAGCPSALAAADGAGVSIVDVSRLGGQTLTFSYRDSDTDFYDQHHNTFQVDQYNVTPGGVGQVFFYFTPSCTTPGWPDMVLNRQPVAARSQAFTVPLGSKWLAVRSTFGSTNLHWQAQ